MYMHEDDDDGDKRCLLSTYYGPERARAAYTCHGLRVAHSLARQAAGREAP